MKIVVFGLTITSAWGNGHATTFRALLKALARRGHTIVFVEKDVEWYRNHRDLPSPDFCQLVLYDDWLESAPALLAQCADADAIVVGSYFPDAIACTHALVDAGYGPVLFYDIDTPVTLTALRRDGRTDYLNLEVIPLYDAYLSFSGGPSLVEVERVFHARRAVAFYCSVDPDAYLPQPVQTSFACDMSYLGTYAVDRQPKLLELLCEPARLLPESRFLVAGAQYPEQSWPGNVGRLDHVAPQDHPAFYSSARYSLNLTRADMVAAGYSPSVRLFEASACGAALISDDWPGLDRFFTPGEEILVAGTAQEVTTILLGMTEEERVRIGARARERTLAHHTAYQRALEFEGIVSSLSSSVNEPSSKSGPASLSSSPG